MSFTHLRNMTARLGITLNDAKSAILLPPGAPDPPAHLAEELADLITRDGIVIAGTPVGAPEFVARHAAAKVDDTVHHIANCLGEMAKLNPQVAMRIFTGSVSHRFSYYARVTPPALIKEAINRLEAAIPEIRDRILYQQEQRPQMDLTRALRANSLTTLPIGKGGLGLYRPTELFPAAYISSLASCADGLEADSLRSHLTCHAEPAHALLCRHLGGTQTILNSSTLVEILPTEGRYVTEGPFYLDNHHQTQKSKIQGPLCNTIANRRFDRLKDTCIEGIKALDPRHPTPSETFDLAHTALVATRSQISRHLRVSLANRHNRIDANPFIRYICFHLNLPQPLCGDASYLSPALACDVDPCKRCGGQQIPIPLDPVGNHCAAGCPLMAKPRHSLHDSLTMAAICFSKEAGCTTAAREPSPVIILDNHITHEQARLIFPKDPNAALNSLAEKAQRAMADLSAAKQDCDQTRVAELTDRLNEMQRSISDNTQARRPDAYLVAPNGQQRILDVTVVHPTSPSYILATKQFLIKLRDEDERARNTNTPNRMLRQPSPRIASAETQKNKKYAPLVQVATLLKQRGLRAQVPKFLPCAATHEGELSPSFFELIEWLTTLYKKRCEGEIAASPRPDGRRLDQLTASFRTRFKDAIAVSIAKGFGAMLTASAAGVALSPGY